MRELLTPEVPIVIDPGSYRWRVGFANLEKPKSSYITETFMLDGTSVEEQGLIVDFQCNEFTLAYYERYFNHGLRILHCDPKSVSLCVALPLSLSPKYRNQLAEILFERVGVKSIFFASQPLVSAFSSGKPTCLIVDSGHSYTSLYGVNDLYPERSTELIYSIGGRDVDQYLKSLAGPQLRDSTAGDINYIKSRFCNISPTPLSETALGDKSNKRKPCQMLDGQELHLGIERQLAPEIIFNPQLNGFKEKPSLETAIFQSVRNLTEEKSNEILKNVVLSGGNLKFKGLRERLQKGLPNCRICYHPEGELAVWRGAAIFASMSTFEQMVVSKQRWAEHGEFIIQRKWL
nr:actin protein 9 [Hymenolepis microstoma]